MWPSSKAGSTTWSVDQPSTQASATVSAPKSRLPSVESAKIHGSRRIATASTPNPARVVDPCRPARSSVTSSTAPVCAPGRPDARRLPREPRGAVRVFPDADRSADSAPRLPSPHDPLPRPTGTLELCDLALRPGRGRPHPLRGLGRQGPRRAPAGPGAPPARRGRDRRPRALRARRAGDDQGEAPRLRGAGREGARPRVHAVRPAAGGPPGQHAGVLRPPRGPAPGAARLGAARARPGATSRACGRRSGSPAAGWPAAPGCRCGSGAATPARPPCCARATTPSW